MRLIKTIKMRFGMWLADVLEKPARKCVAGWQQSTDSGEDDYGCALRDCDDCPCIIAILPRWITKILVKCQRRKEDEMIKRLEAPLVMDEYHLGKPAVNHVHCTTASAQEPTGIRISAFRYRYKTWKEDRWAAWYKCSDEDRAAIDEAYAFATKSDKLEVGEIKEI